MKLDPLNTLLVLAQITSTVIQAIYSYYDLRRKQVSDGGSPPLSCAPHKQKAQRKSRRRPRRSKV